MVQTIYIVALTFVPAGANVAHTASLNQCVSAIVRGCREPLRTICVAEVCICTNCQWVVAAQQIVPQSCLIDIVQSRAGTGLTQWAQYGEIPCVSECQARCQHGKLGQDANAAQSIPDL